MGTVIDLCARLARPNWMAKPDSWMWLAPEGHLQGFGRSWRDNPGQANLLWLTMGLDAPPASYDVRRNPYYTLVMVLGRHADLNGEPIFDLAATMPLHAFAELLPDTVTAAGLPQVYPKLKEFALKRLAHAHP